ncbi:MAG: hypothetical protein WCE21_00375 [Candidatus Babeliales bacterium]
MRKQFKQLSALVLGASALIQADHRLGTSKTFFSIRPIFQDSMPEKESLWRDRALAREGGINGAFQIVPLGGQSTQSSDIAQYFSPNSSNTIIFAEDLAEGSTDLLTTAYTSADSDANGAGNPNFRDVNAIFFNIQTLDKNFKSTVTFKPRHSYAGVGLDYKQYLHRRDCCDKRWWLEVSTPLEWVSNDMRLTESIQEAGIAIDGTSTSVAQAFTGVNKLVVQSAPDSVDSTVTGSGWQYGIINGARSHFAAADVTIKLGYDYLCDDCFHADGYLGGVIPAGNKTKGVYVFEPIVGNEFHGGLMWGGTFGWEMWSSCDRYLHLELATNGRYLFPNTQVRAFDVRGKPWSRYMSVYNTDADALDGQPIEGINVFTQKVRVSPRFNKDINSAVVYTHHGFQGELGYNFWAKQSEHISLKNEFPTTITFANVGGGFVQPAFEPGFINRALTIKENFFPAAVNLDEEDPATFADLAITEEDLDLQTAAATFAITHNFYGSIGYRWDHLCYPVCVGLGGSYELASERGAINRWMVWGKLGVSI